MTKHKVNGAAREGGLGQKQKNKTSAFSSKSLLLISRNKEQLHSLGNKILASMIFVVIIAYIATINDLSIKGFILQDLRGNISQLEIDNEQYELKAMNLESYELINERAQKLGMVKVDDIKYVAVIDGVVAIR